MHLQRHIQFTVDGDEINTRELVGFRVSEICLLSAGLAKRGLSDLWLPDRHLSTA